MKDEIEVVVEKTETRRIDLTTDDIEALLTKALKLSKNAEFNWSIGQWASLSVVDKRKEKRFCDSNRRHCMFFVNLRPEYRANALRVAFQILGCEVKSTSEYGPDGNKYEAISFPRMYTGDEEVEYKLQALSDAGFMPDILMDAAAEMLGRGMSCCTAFVIHPGKEIAGSWADLQPEGGTGGRP